MKTKTNLITLFLATTLFTLTGCTVDMKKNWEAFLVEEYKTIPNPPERSPNIMTSQNFKDYIREDGVGIAIPSQTSFELYISPFAPTSGYVQSRKAPGTIIRCPYTNKKLVIGDRYDIQEMDLP